MSTVFVTGATGTVGAAVAAQLAARGERVIAGVRSGHAARRLPDGVDARLFEFASTPEQLRRVMGGADRLFLMRPPQIADVQRFLIPVIDAAEDLGMRQVVFLSLQGVQFNRNTPHHQVEAYLKATRAPYTMLRPNFFMQNLSSTYADDIARHGEIRVPAGRSRTAFIDARDIGAVTATVLTEPGHDRKAYTLSGEQSLSYTDVAQIMSRVLGRPITYTRPTEHEHLAQLAVDQGDRVGREGVLKFRELVQLLEQSFGIDAVLGFDHQAGAVGQVR